jgi:hypothetical protein
MDDTNVPPFEDIPDPFARQAAAPVPPADVRGFAESAPRARVRQRRLVAVVCALLVEAAWLLLVEHRHDLETSSRVRLAVGLGVPLFAAFIALLGLERRGPLGLGESPLRLSAFVVGSACVFIVGTLLGAPAWGDGPGFWDRAARCMRVTAVLGTVPLVLGVWAFRHAFPASAPWRTALLGVACGGLAAATMSVACPDDAAAHAIVGHGVMMLVGGLAGAAVGRFATRA